MYADFLNSQFPAQGIENLKYNKRYIVGGLLDPECSAGGFDELNCYIY